MRLTDFRTSQILEMASFRWASKKDDKEARFFGTRKAAIPTTVIIAKTSE